MTHSAVTDVLYSGAVALGPDVVCDGFSSGVKCRVQTHIHSDHMSGFDASKGLQQILLTEETRALLCFERNADLPYRSNLCPTPYGVPVHVGASKVSLMPAGHMLGSAQVVVEVGGGACLGYSGDFSWPLEEVIQVERLVVDSTYGKPTSVRRYSQTECEVRLLELTEKRLVTGSVHVLAHRGTLHRAATILSGGLRHAIIAGSDTIAEIDVYRAFGAAISEVLDLDSDEGYACHSSGRYVWIGRPTRRVPRSPGEVTTIKLSAFFSRPDQPVTELGNRVFSIALSDHADFDGTLEYVAATGAKEVVTDNTRGAGLELALAIKDRLGIDARPSSNHREDRHSMAGC